MDADCLITREPSDAFDGNFDLGLTWRKDPNCIINNGAMYVSAGSKARVLQFFRYALSICEDHWGGDQEAISITALPAPTMNNEQGMRHGALVRFLSMRIYNCIPEREGVVHKSPGPIVVHFKGEHRKAWMRAYASKFVFGIPSSASAMSS